MNTKLVSIAAVSIALVTGTVGCGTTSASTNHASTGTSSNTANTDNTLVVYSAGPKPLAQSLISDFEKKTGIHVQLFQSTTGKVLGRLQAEKSNPQADVVALADWSAGDALKQQGMLMTFHPANESKVLWKDASSTYFGYSASALGITYNTQLVKNPPQSWSDVLNASYQGKVVMPDPAQSGSAVDFVGGYLQNHNNSWDFFNKLHQHGDVVQGANAEALNQVITGSKDMVLAGVDYMAYGDIAKGEPLGIVYPKDGTVINPRPIMILKSSKHIQNAEAFVNFVLSQQGQADVAKKYLLPAVQGDATNPKRASLSQIPGWTVDWASLSKNKAEIVSHVDGLLQ